MSGKREKSESDVNNFFIDNTQNRSEDQILLSSVHNELENFYSDEIGDFIINQTYDEFLASIIGENEDLFDSVSEIILVCDFFI